MQRATSLWHSRPITKLDEESNVENYRNGDAMAKMYRQRLETESPVVPLAQSSTQKPRLPRFWLLAALLSAFAGGWLVGESKPAEVVTETVVQRIYMSNYSSGGAGTAEWNGTLVQQATTVNGQPIWQIDASHLMYRALVSGTYYWVLNGTVNATGSLPGTYVAAYSAPDAATPPLTGWVVKSGAAPAPTLALASAAAAKPGFIAFC